MYCQVFLSGIPLKVGKCLKEIRNISCVASLCGSLIETRITVKQSPKCRNFSSTPVPVPYMPPKEKLMKCLYDIKGDDNATLLCGLLLEASLVLEQSKSTNKNNSWREYKTHEIVNQLKKVITGDKSGQIIAERFVEGIYAFLPGDYSGKASELLPFLLEIENVQKNPTTELDPLNLKIENSESPNLKFKNSEEYLKHLLKALESHFSESIKRNELFPRFSPEDSLHNLETLRTFLMHSADCKADSLLILIFEVGQTHLDFSEKEKEEIGNLMIGTIKPIERCLEDVSFSFNSRCSVFQRRSSLQFIKDDYAKFPVGNESLLVEFFMGKINNSIKVLDNFITKLCKIEDTKFMIDTWEEDLDEVERYVDNCWDSEECELEEAGATNLPESHTWWATYSEKFLRKYSTEDENDQQETEDEKSPWWATHSEKFDTKIDTEDENDRQVTEDEKDQKYTEDEKDRKETEDKEGRKETEDQENRKETKEKD